MFAFLQKGKVPCVLFFSWPRLTLGDNEILACGFFQGLENRFSHSFYFCVFFSSFLDALLPSFWPFLYRCDLCFLCFLPFDSVYNGWTFMDPEIICFCTETVSQSISRLLKDEQLKACWVLCILSLTSRRHQPGIVMEAQWYMRKNYIQWQKTQERPVLEIRLRND